MTSTTSTTRTRGASRWSRPLSGVLLGSLFVALFLALPGDPVRVGAGGAKRTLPTASTASTALTSYAGSTAVTDGASALRVGISPGFELLDLPTKRLRADLRSARALGAQQLRVDVSWARIQPRKKGGYHWADTDRVLAAADAAGLDVLAVVGYRPRWGSRPNGAVQPAGFARFVAAAAKRYRDEIDAWELWNEPNQRLFWIAKPSPAGYARLVEATAPGIRRHDPGAPILIGALAPAVDAGNGREISPLSFLQGVYRSGIDRDAFDAVSVHPYSYPALPSGDQPWNTFHRLEDLHAIMRRAGDGAKGIWLTEYGAPTGTSDRAVSAKRHRRMLVSAHREARSLDFVHHLFYYSLRDSSSRRDDPESNFGFLKARGKAKPAYAAVRRELRKGH